ncbi:AAA family ATPase [Pseudomonas sp. URIL14HWK12:I5]|uniref:AAA family ATPase n=1 Tax=Pseudomonas sp. URIL14HWK12:I5 TaxID=1261630 RepID=UPI0009D8DB5A|nr:AAA family ATPase [Pseudomonas sp. URIL14HWK12:I5]SMC43543.1 DNA sulfur modification protein DndD [Pseudomonas sp. URIL14HWK12:I5]
MKLLEATIKNFRLLKELTLDFSVDPEKPLTVIRAANETGKTTCQNALMWCLYGSKALPRKGEYSLFPSDASARGEKRVEVSVEIRFEVEHATGLGKGRHQISTQRYHLIRSCVENAPKEGAKPRHSEVRALWRSGLTGDVKVPDLEVDDIIEGALPESLKDVYFTDGDSAMSFIEAAASQSIKRQRVTNAIEALLGLTTLEKTVSHLGTVVARFSQEIDNKNYAKELEILNDRINGLQEDIEEWKAKREEAELNIAEVTREHALVESKIEEALLRGDKEKLVKKKAQAQQNISRLSENAKQQLKVISSLASGEELSLAILEGAIVKVKDNLNKRNQSKQLPKVNVPILEELLDRDSCFCGSDLTADSLEGRSRRSKISGAIEKSRASDLVQESASSLFYRIRSVDPAVGAPRWISRYSEMHLSYSQLLSSVTMSERELQEVEEDLSTVQGSHVPELKDQRLKLLAELQKLRSDEGTHSSRIHEATERLKDADREREVVRKKLGKTNTSTINYDLAKEAQVVFSTIIDRLRHEELKKVSVEMNRIFLSMIGSEGEKSQFGLIQSAELTDEFDIMVYGPDKHRLNPDQDLNGASRRAITLSFILALTKISEVEAPNIIDTPLGMMSGYVKQSVLINTIKEGSQVVLFLTHDEIKGVEEILDRHAGRVFTLTNPAHYPKMLLNKPEVSDSRVVRCECDHRGSCDVCERKSMELV